MITSANVTGCGRVLRDGFAAMRAVAACNTGIGCYRLTTAGASRILDVVLLGVVKGTRSKAHGFFLSFSRRSRKFYS